MSAAVWSVVPVFAVLLIGYLAGRSGRIAPADIGPLNVLMMEFLIPAALFRATSQTHAAALVGHAGFGGAILVSMLVLYGIVFELARRWCALTTGEAAVVALVVSFPNFAAIGLPLAQAVLEPGGLVFGALGIALGAIVTSPITLAILESGTRTGSRELEFALVRSLRRPLVVAPVLGMLLSLTGVGLPHVVGGIVDLLSAAAGGVALILTGLVLSSQAFQLSPAVLAFTLLKNLAHPLIALAAGLAFGLHGLELRALVILCAIPCGFFGILFGLRFEIRSEIASSTLLMSNVASLITLTGATALLPR